MGKGNVNRLYAPSMSGDRYCAKSDKPSKFVGLALLAFTAAALVWRLPIGIDLTDEAYYAIFIDDWLKGGIASSTLVTLHQTAALVVYPAVRMYVALSGSGDGLILFLRFCFLMGAICASATWFALLCRIAPPFQAATGAAIVLAFIPFGLPAPSYNTIGQQALLVALGALGNSWVEERKSRAWATLSAGAWAIAVVAYPSMAVPLAACVLTATIWGPSSWPRRTYIGLIAGFQAAAWTIVVAALSWRKLFDSIAYLSAINDVGGWLRKAAFTFRLLEMHPRFVAACAVAIVLGLVRSQIGTLATSLLMIGLAVLVYSGEPALILHSHDLVTVLALTGVGLLGGLRARASLHARLLAILWLIGFTGGLVTMSSAFNSLYNFQIGAAPAAVAAVVGLTLDSRPVGFVVTATLIAVWGCLLASSLSFHYGDPPGASLPRERMRGGPFAGLVGRSEQVETINWMRNEVAPLLGPDRTIAFFGRLYGLILATPARPRMMAVFPLHPTMNPIGLAMTSAFFDAAAHRPGLVVIHTDMYIQPWNPMERRFAEWYAPVKAEQLPMGTFQIFRRR